MAKEALIHCPHCGTSYTTRHGFTRGNGTHNAQCPKCHKMAKVRIRKGEVHQVDK